MHTYHTININHRGHILSFRLCIFLQQRMIGHQSFCSTHEALPSFDFSSQWWAHWRMGTCPCAPWVPLCQVCQVRRPSGGWYQSKLRHHWRVCRVKNTPWIAIFHLLHKRDNFCWFSKMHSSSATICFQCRLKHIVRKIIIIFI